MLIRLSKNAYVRQYGPFTYVIERIKNFDQVYLDAEVFFRWLTREPMEIAEVLGNICKVYEGADQRQINQDFNEFIAPLIRAGVLATGKDEDELRKNDPFFSYDVENPKTMDTHAVQPKADGEVVTQDVLDKYFAEHPTIFTLQMDITQACTERCVHCYIPEYNPVFLDFKTICRVIDEFREQGGLTLTLSGGECMMHPDFDRIVRYAHEKDLIVGVLSNLTLCDDEKVALLAATESTVQVSLYSMNPATHDAITRRPGSFEKTKTAIEKIRRAQIPCRISCPTMKANYKDYLDVLNYARSLRMDAQTDFIIMGKMNCDTSNLACRLDLSETRHLLEDIVYKSLPVNNEYFDPAKKDLLESDEDFAKRKVCGACVDSVCLDADGHYYPCAAFGGVSLGSCHEHDLKWIWNESPETRRIRSVTGGSFPKCVHCADRAYCSVCMCRNYNETSDIFTPAQHFCDVAKVNHEVVDEAQRRRMEMVKG